MLHDPSAGRVHSSFERSSTGSAAHGARAFCLRKTKFDKITFSRSYFLPLQKLKKQTFFLFYGISVRFSSKRHVFWPNFFLFMLSTNRCRYNTLLRRSVPNQCSLSCDHTRHHRLRLFLLYIIYITRYTVHVITPIFSCFFRKNFSIPSPSSSSIVKKSSFFLYRACFLSKTDIYY